MAQSELLDRLPPHSQEAERGVLGSIFIEPARIDDVAPCISAGDFYVDAHRRLFRHCIAMRDAGDAVDMVTLLKRLVDAKEDVAVGGAPYLAEILHSVPYAENAKHYAKIVAEQSRRRRIIESATAMLIAAWDASKSVDEIIADCEAALQKIPTGEYAGEPVPFSQSLLSACDMVDEIARHKRTSGVMIGLENFDTAAGGLFPGELVVLAARPSIGKTALGLQVAKHVAARGRLCYVASLEMRSTELALRMLCGDSGISMARVRAGDISQADLYAISESAATMGSYKIVLHDRAGMSVADICRACRRLAAKSELGLVVVDYLQRITPSDRRADRHLQVGQITWDLKAMALELRVPVLCLCQVSRAANERDKKTGLTIEPRIEHLKESGDIEQDADMILLLHRQQRASNAVMILAKNRQGEQARFNLAWDAERTQFSCAAPANRETDFDSYGNDF